MVSEGLFTNTDRRVLVVWFQEGEGLVLVHFQGGLVGLVFDFKGRGARG